MIPHANLRLPSGAPTLETTVAKVEALLTPELKAVLGRVGAEYDGCVTDLLSFSNIYLHIRIETLFPDAAREDQMEVVNLLNEHHIGYRFGHNIKFVPEGWYGCEWGERVWLERPFGFGGMQVRDATMRPSRCHPHHQLAEALINAGVDEYRFSRSHSHSAGAIHVRGFDEKKRLEDAMQRIRIRETLSAK